MSDDFEARVTRALHDSASTVNSNLGDLGDAVAIKGQRIRQRRAVLGAVAGVVVVVLAVAALVNGSLFRGEATKEPVGPGTDAPTSPSSADPSHHPKVRTLPVGASPSVVHMVGDGRRILLVDGKTQIELPDRRSWAPVAGLGSSYLMYRHGAGFTGADEYDADLVVLETDASFSLVAHGGIERSVAVSTDRSEFVYATLSPQGDAALHRAALPDGQIVGTVQVPNAILTPEAVGRSGAVVSVLNIARSGSGIVGAPHVMTWTGGDASALVEIARGDVVGASRDASLVLVNDPRDRAHRGARRCVRLFATDTRQQVWKLCGSFAHSLSPDGERVVTNRLDGEGVVSVNVSNSEQRPIQYPWGAGIQPVRWETNRAFVSVAIARQEEYLVRCETESGRCERALGPVGDVWLALSRW